MYIRKATLDDLQTLVDLGRRTFQHAFAADNNPDDIALYLDEAFSQERLQNELLTLETAFLLAFADSDRAQPLGYACLFGGSAIPGVEAEQPIEISRLYLEGWAIGQGYGSKLMQVCLDYAADQGFQTIWLGVWEKNVRAQQFYERWGFRQVGAQVFQLGRDSQTDWIMARAV